MHNGYINVDNKKMSKSLGNFFTVRDIAAEYDLEAVRLFMLSAHYRSPVNFSRDLIEQAKSALERLKNCRERIADAKATALDQPADAEFMAVIEKAKQSFIDAMDDDLNTADALGALYNFVREANIRFSQPQAKEEVEAAEKLFAELTGVLGVLNKRDEIPAEIIAKAEARTAARKAKDWKLADALRDEITAAGYVIEDTPNGPKVKKA